MKMRGLTLAAAALVLASLAGGLQAAKHKKMDPDVEEGYKRGKEDAEARVKGGTDPAVREGYKRGKREAEEGVRRDKYRKEHGDQWGTAGSEDPQVGISAPQAK